MGNSTIFDNVKVESAEIFLIERYKYILEQKREANKTTFKVAAIFQAIFVPIVGVQMLLIKEASSGGVSISVAKVGSVVLFFLTLFISLMCCTLILGGIVSWLKYRRDESDIENIVFSDRRSSPNFRNSFRWYETYILLGMLIAEVGYCFALPNVIMPMIGG